MWRKEKRKLAQEVDTLHDVEGNLHYGAFRNNKKGNEDTTREITAVAPTTPSLSDSDTIKAEGSLQNSKDNNGDGRQQSVRSRLRKTMVCFRPIRHYVTGQ